MFFDIWQYWRQHFKNMCLPVTAKRMQLSWISCFPICRFNQQNKQNFNTAQCWCAATLKTLRDQIERTGAINRIASNMLPNMTPAKSDSRRRLNVGAATSHGGNYIKVEEDQTDGFVNEQWTAPIVIDEGKPWKIISIILSLFVSGSVRRKEIRDSNRTHLSLWFRFAWYVQPSIGWQIKEKVPIASGHSL